MHLLYSIMVSMSRIILLLISQKEGNPIVDCQKRIETIDAKSRDAMMNLRDDKFGPSMTVETHRHTSKSLDDKGRKVRKLFKRDSLVAL